MKDENKMSRRDVMKLLGVLALGSGLSAGGFALGRDAENGASLPKPSSRGKILVVHYSRSGNTAKIARYIQAASGAESFEIVPSVPYPDDYEATVAQARKEIAAGFKPELKTKPESIAEYEAIFVGSPCWWATMAPPVAAFLAAYDVAGKTIIPFMTHEGSGLGHYVEDLRKLCPTARVLDGKAFRGGRVGEAQQEAEEWVKGLRLNA